MAVYRRKDTASKRWFFKFQIDGVTYKAAIPTARTCRQAEEAERQARDDVHAGRYQSKRRSVNFRKFVEEEYLPWAKQHRQNYTERKATCGLLVSYLGNYSLAEISEVAISRFKRDYSEKINKHKRLPKASTVNQRVASLSAILKHAVKLKRLRRNPCEDVENLPTDDDEVRPLTHEEEEMLMPELRCEPAWVFDVTRVALGTGFRISEALGISKGTVDFSRNLLFVGKAKWKKDPRKTKGIPMSTEVREILLRLSRGRSHFLFVHHETGKPISRSTYYNRLVRACERVGIYDVHPHTLRHTFGSRLGDADLNIKKIQRLMGHADIKMTERYIHPADESLRSAVELVVQKRPENVPREVEQAHGTARKSLKAVG